MSKPHDICVGDRVSWPDVTFSSRGSATFKTRYGVVKSINGQFAIIKYRGLGIRVPIEDVRLKVDKTAITEMLEDLNDLNDAHARGIEIER